MPEGHVTLSHVLTSLWFRNHGAGSPAQETTPAATSAIPTAQIRKARMTRWSLISFNGRRCDAGPGAHPDAC